MTRNETNVTASQTTHVTTHPPDPRVAGRTTTSTEPKWKKELEIELANQEETFESINYLTMAGDDDEEARWHIIPPFTAWTEKRVYFPVEHDGMESVASVPRHPCEERTNHVGGG